MARMANSDKTMDKVVALCKNRGFVYAGSEIYGGLANTWDYGPLGCELKANVKLYGEYSTEDTYSDDRELEALTEETEVNRVCWGMGERLPLQDDLILSPADGEWRVVCAEGTVMINEASVGGHGIVNYVHGTKLKIKDIELREIAWKPRTQLYDPDF